MIVSNSTPLIYLAKLNKIDLLKRLYRQVVIPHAVFHEVVVKGKQLDKKEVCLIERLVSEEFLKVARVEPNVKDEFRVLHRGEIEAISLCLQKKVKSMLVDDKDGCEVCKLFSIEPIRTTRLLLEFFKEGLFSLDELRESHAKLSREGHFMSIDVFQRLLNAAEKFSDKKK